MEELGKPVNERLQKLDKIIKASMSKDLPSVVDFSNTKNAFAGKTDAQLKHTARMFRMMNSQFMVSVGTRLGLLALKMHIPFTKKIIRETMYKQFVGGRTLLETEDTITHLAKYNSFTILDYGAEGKETEDELNQTLSETIRAIEFAGKNKNVPVVSTKITGLASNELLIKMQREEELSGDDLRSYRNVLKRVDSLCHVASANNVKLFFDAEESWMQDSIDHLVTMMMKRYNKETCIVYNTFQMYRHDRLKYLTDSFDTAKQQGYILGAKLVRGAYMEKEREHAYENNHDSPIQPNKGATDDHYNTALRFCVDNYKDIALCNATHNADSSRLLAQLIVQKGLRKDHPHLNFAQLLGMSDNITFNLAEAGFNVAKYVPFGPVSDVYPYLVRRAHENSAVTGDMSREYALVSEEMKRRGI